MFQNKDSERNRLSSNFSNYHTLDAHPYHEGLGFVIPLISQQEEVYFLPAPKDYCSTITALLENVGQDTKLASSASRSPVLPSASCSYTRR